LQGARRRPWWVPRQAVQRRRAPLLQPFGTGQISLMRRCRSLLGHYPTASAPPCLRGNLPRSRPRRILRQAPGTLPQNNRVEFWKTHMNIEFSAIEARVVGCLIEKEITTRISIRCRQRAHNACIRKRTRAGARTHRGRRAAGSGRIDEKHFVSDKSPGTAAG